MHVTIVGAGVTGLTAALLLAENGHTVTIVSHNSYGDTSTEWASPWAGALLAPNADYGHPSLQRQSLERWAELHRHKPESGVKKLRITEYYDDRPHDAEIWYEGFVSGFRRLGKDDLLPGTTLGFTYHGYVVNPNQFLPWIMKELRSCGVSFINQKLHSLDEAKGLGQADFVVNASGLGARNLVPDSAVTPIRGQTMFVPTDKLDEAILRQGSQYTYMIPRHSDGGVILGGVAQPGNTNQEPDPSLRGDILARINNMTQDRFSWLASDDEKIKDIVGFRPGRKGGLRLQKEERVIHAYGLGALGYVYSWGIAASVRGLVEEKSFGELVKS
jgi:D-amino-acid oxidase